MITRTLTLLTSLALCALPPLALASAPAGNRAGRPDPRIELFGVRFAGRSRPAITHDLERAGLRPDGTTQGCDTFRPPVPAMPADWRRMDRLTERATESVTVCYTTRGVWRETDVIYPDGLGAALAPLEQAFAKRFGRPAARGNELEGYTALIWYPDHGRYAVVINVGFPEPITEVALADRRPLPCRRDIGATRPQLDVSSGDLSGGR